MNNCVISNECEKSRFLSRELLRNDIKTKTQAL